MSWVYLNRQIMAKRTKRSWSDNKIVFLYAILRVKFFPSNSNIFSARYGNLIKNLWSCTSRTLAPLKMRWTIAKFAPQFTGFSFRSSQLRFTIYLFFFHVLTYKLTGFHLVLPVLPFMDIFIWSSIL